MPYCCGDCRKCFSVPTDRHGAQLYPATEVGDRAVPDGDETEGRLQHEAPPRSGDLAGVSVFHGALDPEALGREPQAA